MMEGRADGASMVTRSIYSPWCADNDDVIGGVP